MRKYGLIFGKPDDRDYKFGVEETIKLPQSVDLESGMPPVYDQKSLGSCSANAIAAAIEFDLKKQLDSDFMPSRLFIYYNERLLEDSVSEDSGAMLRDGMKVINTQGVCHETTWPYDISKFTDKPVDTAYVEALSHKAVSYHSVNQTEYDIKSAMALGFPVVFGFNVYQSFESQKVALNGIVSMPTDSENCLGGHAVVLVGYDDETKRFKVRNSWGVDWGNKGYFYLPYEYVLDPDLARDFWVVQVVS